MSKLRACIRAEVFEALQDENERVPLPTRENLVINDLIREYLAFNHYDHTLAVFLPGARRATQAGADTSLSPNPHFHGPPSYARTESGQPRGAVDRQYLSEQTNLPAQHGAGWANGHEQVQLPLLYGLLAQLQPEAVDGARRRSLGEAPSHISLAGSAVPAGADDTEVQSRYRAAAQGAADDDSIPGTARLPRPRKEPRALGGGAPDPLHFMH